MKKLLLLGGIRYLIPVIKTAKKLGIYTITCDYLPGNIAHKYSDEYQYANITDKNQVLELAKRMKIDGITSFGVDPGVVTAAYVAEKLGLPKPGPLKSIEILQNKSLFRDFLRNNNFNVPNSWNVSSNQELNDIKQQITLPVIVKPVDAAGSKGVSKVSDKYQLEEAFDYAQSFSKTKNVIIEDFIEKKGYSSDTDSFSINSELVFFSINNQYFNKNAPNPYTPSGFSWPSFMSKDNQLILEKEIQRLIKLLKLETSIYNIEVRESKNGTPYIMEMAPRGGGNRLSEVLKMATGEDLIENSVLAAIGETPKVLKQPNYNGFWAEQILFSLENGVYDGIEFDDAIEEFIIEKDIWVKRGDRVEKFTAANKTLGTVIFRFDSKESLSYYMENIDKYIKINVNS